MSTQFGKYVLQRKLAEGGMAELFLARQSGLEGFEKLLVIKRILPQLTADESFIKMFLNEARVAARLNHPNVVQIFDLGKIGEQYFIAMEYVHGEDLRAVLLKLSDRDQRAPLGLGCRILADTLAGLHYAHTRVGADGKPLGLVHRDVSPQNVLITYEGSVKLVDFGIAKATRAVGATQTQAGLLKGKYAYMAPEQARGQPVDARSDVFCVGILLWELATWQRLFKRPTELATLMAVAEEPIPTPRSVEPAVPVELERVIMKALARQPEERYQSALEMRAALEQLIRASGWEADSLALSTWMREVFADKLRAQAADVAAAGLASLEDFLLTVEEKTSISWMAVAGDKSKKTPTSGLAAAVAPVDVHAATATAGVPYDDGPTTQLTDLQAEATTAGTPVLPLDASRAPEAAAAPKPAEAAKPPPVRAEAATVKAMEAVHAPTIKAMDAVHPPTASGVIVPSAAAFTAPPSAQTLGVMAPPTPAGSETPSMSLPPGDNPLFGGDRATAKRPAMYEEPPPSPMRRILVAGSVALVIAAVALTVAFWPARPAVSVHTLAPSPGASPSGSAAASPGGALAAGAQAAAGARSGARAGAAAPATLVISVDAPANIAVDGARQPLGQSATVTVEPGVQHVVTVQRPGHSVRRLHVPALAPGERMPLHFSVR